MPVAKLRHFAINADDMDRAKGFYHAVFGWAFEPWGPPGFLQIDGPGVGGALHGRREIEGHAMPGLEITFGVEDIRETVKAIEAAGGEIIMPVFHIPTVGRLIYFKDTEGNIAGAMQYDEHGA